MKPTNISKPIITILSKQKNIIIKSAETGKGRVCLISCKLRLLVNKFLNVYLISLNMKNIFNNESLFMTYFKNFLIKHVSKN